MATFILVPGFWLGAWAWRPVTDRLRAAGHTVYPMSLTGLGERVHLGGPHVTLETHIKDIVNLIRYEDLRDVVLVGHSGPGVTITGVADRMAERLRHIIYVDSAPLPDGRAQIETYPPDLRTQLEQQVAAEGDGWRFAMPPTAELGSARDLEGLSEADLAAMRERAAPEPFGAATEPLRLSNPVRTTIPTTIIWNTFSPEQVAEILASAEPLWSELHGPQVRFEYLPTSHWPMFSKPAELADLLMRVAATSEKHQGADL